MTTDLARAEGENMPEIMTIAEVAEMTRTPIETCRYWRHIGKGPKSYKLGRRLAYDRADVEAWLAEQKAAAIG